MLKTNGSTLFTRLLPYIIPFGFGIILGYLLQVPSAFSSVISGISGGTILGLIGLFIAWFKERKGRRLNHSRVLVDKNLRSRTKTYVGFVDYFNCDLCVQIKNLIQATPESDIYSKEVDAHLESGYENVWKIMRKRESLISEHDAKAKQFLINLKSKIIEELKQKNHLTEWDGIGQPPIKYFTKYLLFEVGCIIQFSYERTTDIDLLLKVEKAIDQWKTFRWQLSYNRVLVAGDDEKEIREIKQMIIDTLGDAINNEDFKVLKKSFEEIKNQHNLFITEINEIIKDVENDIPINGLCRICQEF